jgi:hypothetical protein
MRQKEVITLCDPPSGWRYGFPKQFPAVGLEGMSMSEWLIANGYPKKAIDEWPDLINHCRFFDVHID